MSPAGKPKSEELNCEILIIGGGGAGLGAALEASEKGCKDIIVLEKRRATGGNTAMSSGMIGIDSPVMKREGIEFYADKVFKICMEWSHWKLNGRLVRALINQSGDTIRWLESKGLHFSIIPMYPNQDPRCWHAADGRGAQMMKVLYDQSVKAGVRFYLNTPAKKLLKDAGGRVIGAVAEKDGKRITIKADSVIISTGGYGGNREMLRKYSDVFKENMQCDGVRHTGDGINMAIEAGAATEGLGFLLMSGPQIPNAMLLKIDVKPEPVLVQLMGIALEPNTCWVNKFGKRYIDESTSFHHYVCSQAVNRQPDNVTYTLFDQNIMQTMTDEGMIIGLGRYRYEERQGMPGLERELKFQSSGYMYSEEVQKDICNGCAQCVKACPEGAAVLDTLANDEFSPCRFECPAGVDMRTYFYLLRTGRIDEAVKTLREYLPLPAVTGRVCPHLCETECARKEVDEAVNINAIERFVADYSLNEKARPVPKKYKKKVAIVGSGPAGLSAAYFLTKLGYPVTVFEKEKAPGGMLRMGIPEYRLPKKVLDAQIKYIADMGAEFKTGVAIGKDISMDRLQKEFDAVFFATGNQLSRKIELEGSKKEGVLWGLDFLKEANLKSNVKVGNKVVVIGGGNVAVDVALTALRYGAREVQMACLEKGKEIPAYKEEIEQAMSEGVKINEGWGPNKILGAGKVTGIELIKCTSVFDKSGKFNPAYDGKTKKTLDADMVILAVGQSPDFSLAPKALKLDGNAVKADSVTLETSIDGVFAGGDIVNPAGSVVKAIAYGSRAAVSIDRFLKGEDLRKGPTAEPKKVQKPPKEGIPLAARNNTPVKAISKITGNFNEVKPGFDEETANLEANRCMTCGSRAEVHGVDDCRLCKSCEMACPQKAIMMKPLKKVKPHVFIAKNWDEMAKWIGCDPKVLKASIEEYNRACDTSYDAIFGKQKEMLVPLRKPPFYAIMGNSDFLDTIGGIRITENMEVVDPKGYVIPGLFAAGVTTGGWEADTYNDITSGAASGFSVGGGRMAGRSALKYSKELKKKK